MGYARKKPNRAGGGELEEMEFPSSSAGEGILGKNPKIGRAVAG